MSSPNNDTFLPVYDTVPSEWKEAQGFFVEQLKKITEGINAREVALYIEDQILTGGQYIASSNDPTQLRSTFRMTIDFGALPDTASKSIPHNLNFDQYLTLTKFYATATDPINFLGIPIPYSSFTATNAVELSVNATDVVITTSTNYSSYTRCFVVLEFLMEL